MRKIANTKIKLNIQQIKQHSLRRPESIIGLPSHREIPSQMDNAGNNVY